MSRTLHLVLKFPVDYKIAGGTTDTITEHKLVCDKKKRLIWGQGSQRTSEGVSEKNRCILTDQISNGFNTYTFFLANNKGNRELYVGKMLNIYGRGKIPFSSPLIQYIPSYYASTIGTSADQNNVFVDVCTFFRVDDKYIGDITLVKNGDRVIDVRNSSSVFLVNITEELENLISDMLSNPEANFQYQVEQEGIPDDVTVEDKPRDKPSRTSGSGSSSYKRDSKTSKTAIVTAKYKCEIDESHEDFISRVTGENYVEAHHLIPMEYQNDFDNSIDVEANIVSLCVGCHKKLHHATNTVIKPLIEKLYDQRIVRLRDCDIELTKSELISYYK
ncbi:restriction endonuclease [Bacillus sp. AFS094228]|nr:restriction endonuclease [Bacillus sp. AFS094228]